MNKELEEAKRNLYEIINLCEKEIENNDKNTTAILNLKDLKSLKLVLQESDNSIPKEVIEKKIEEIRVSGIKVSNLDLLYELLEGK